MYGRACTYGGRKVVAGSDYLWNLQDLRDLINMDDLKDLEDFLRPDGSKRQSRALAEGD